VGVAAADCPTSLAYLRPAIPLSPHCPRRGSGENYEQDGRYLGIGCPGPLTRTPVPPFRQLASPCRLRLQFGEEIAHPRANRARAHSGAASRLSASKGATAANGFCAPSSPSVMGRPSRPGADREHPACSPGANHSAGGSVRLSFNPKSCRLWSGQNRYVCVSASSPFRKRLSSSGLASVRLQSLWAQRSWTKRRL
jgi:hypothetical protein